MAKKKSDEVLKTEGHNKIPIKKIEIFNPEKEETAWNKEQRELEAEKEKLPIDKIIDIADKKGLFPAELTREQKWEQFIKGIMLSDILKDCMQSSFNEFCKMYNQKNPEENLQFKLHIRKLKNFKDKGNTKAIFGNELVLEMRRSDKYTIVQQKTISFTHVKEIKDEAQWRYALYAAMYQELINFSLTFILVNDDTVRGEIK